MHSRYHWPHELISWELPPTQERLFWDQFWKKIQDYSQAINQKTLLTWNWSLGWYSATNLENKDIDNVLELIAINSFQIRTMKTWLMISSPMLMVGSGLYKQFSVSQKCCNWTDWRQVCSKYISCIFGTSRWCSLGQLAFTQWENRNWSSSYYRDSDSTFLKCIS